MRLNKASVTCPREAPGWGQAAERHPAHGSQGSLICLCGIPGTTWRHSSCQGRAGLSLRRRRLSLLILRGCLRHREQGHEAGPTDVPTDVLEAWTLRCAQMWVLHLQSTHPGRRLKVCLHLGFCAVSLGSCRQGLREDTGSQQGPWALQPPTPHT